MLYKRAVWRSSRKRLDLLFRHERGVRHGHQDRPPDTFRFEFGACACTEGQAWGYTVKSAQQRADEAWRHATHGVHNPLLSKDPKA